MSDPNQPYGAVPPSYPPPGGGGPGGPGGPLGGPPGPVPPSGGSGKGKALWIALAVIGVLALAGIVTALVLLLADGDDDGEATDDPTTSEAVTTDGASTPPTSESTTGPSLTDPPSTDAPSDPPSTSGGPAGTSTADKVANTPEAVVTAFIDSVFAGDCATAEELVTEKYLQEEGSCEDDSIPSDLGNQVRTKVGTAQVNGDKATVPVTITAYGESEKGEFYLTRVDGQWLISGTSD